MIDTDTAEQILQGDDTHPDIFQALGLDLLAEVKRLQEYNTALLHWVMYHSDKDENEVKEMIYE